MEVQQEIKRMQKGTAEILDGEIDIVCVN